jgi:hypothetical protein
MKDEYAKLTHIGAEMTNYFLRLNSKEFSFSIRIIDNISEITITAKDVFLSSQQIEKFKTKLTNPRQQEIEGYYWSLAGGDHVEPELRLISAMTDLVEISSNTNSGTTVKLRR